MVPRAAPTCCPKGFRNPKDRLERLQAAKERLEREAEAERKEQEEKIRAREAEEASGGKRMGIEPVAKL